MLLDVIGYPHGVAVDANCQDAVHDKVQVGTGLLEKLCLESATAKKRGRSPCEVHTSACHHGSVELVQRRFSHGWVYMFLTRMRSTYSHNKFNATSWLCFSQSEVETAVTRERRICICLGSPSPSPRGGYVAQHIAILFPAGRIGHIQDNVSEARERVTKSQVPSEVHNAALNLNFLCTKSASLHSCHTYSGTGQAGAVGLVFTCLSPKRRRDKAFYAAPRNEVQKWCTTWLQSGAIFPTPSSSARSC